jgi:hypothetical protein
MRAPKKNQEYVQKNLKKYTKILYENKKVNNRKQDFTNIFDKEKNSCNI